jgi:ankyrin repeat protein
MSSKARPNWKGTKTSEGRVRPGQVPELEDFVSACHYGNLSKVKEIIEKHEEIPEKNYVNGKSSGGETGLHKAAGEGHEDIVKFLLDIEPDAVNNKTGSGETPLHRAAYKGEYGVAEILLRYDANPDSVNDSGRTPIYLAKCNGHPRVESLLIKRGRGTPVEKCAQHGGTRRRGRGRKATRRRRVMRGGTRRQGCMRCEW